MFLSKQELFELTNYKYRSKQIQWLYMRGYKFEIAADGSPRVLKNYVFKQLGGYELNDKFNIRTTPNFKALK